MKQPATSDPDTWSDTEVLDFLEEVSCGVVIEHVDGGLTWFMVCEDHGLSIGEDPTLRGAIRKAARVHLEQELRGGI